MMSQQKEKQTKPKKASVAAIHTQHTHTAFVTLEKIIKEIARSLLRAVKPIPLTLIHLLVSLGIEFKHFGHGNTAAAVQDPNLTTMLVGFPTYTTHSDQLS